MDDGGAPMLLVTRPAAQAKEWVARLQAEGLPARALPLLEIAAVDDAGQVQAMAARLPAFALVVFVSPNAVERFFAARREPLRWPAATRAGSTGPGTTSALLAAGVPAASIVQPAADAPSFDSEALWAALATPDWHGRQVLIVRGDGGRDWLAATLREHGAQVEFVQAYRRRAPAWSEAEQALLAAAQRSPERFVWWLSSSEAVGHLLALAPGLDWSRSRALASHPRIARSALDAGFGEVEVVPPTLAALRAAWAARRAS